MVFSAACGQAIQCVVGVALGQAQSRRRNGLRLKMRPPADAVVRGLVAVLTDAELDSPIVGEAGAGRSCSLPLSDEALQRMLKVTHVLASGAYLCR